MLDIHVHIQKYIFSDCSLYVVITNYSKCPKIPNFSFYTFLAQILLFMQLFPKIPSGMEEK